MTKLFSYIYLIVLAIVLIWLVVSHPPTIFIMLALICAMLILIGLGFVYIRIQDAWTNLRYRQRLQRLLGDMTIEEVLAQSPYEYGYVFQGDDGYRIWRKDSIYDFVQVGVSRKAAQMWIVEQYFNRDRDSS